MRHFYLRDRDTLFPVACIATERPDATKIIYALTVFHEGDICNIALARHTARERLTKYMEGYYDNGHPAAWNMLGTVLLQSEKDNAKVELLRKIAEDRNVPSSAKAAAKEWVANMTGTPEQKAVQRKLDKECRQINGRLKVSDWWRDRAVGLQIELDKLRDAVA
jgi:hypothetical protein